MKNVYLFLFVIFSISLYAQDIPNAGFEAWTEGNPDGWLAVNFPGVATPVTQTDDAHSGSSAVKLEIADFMGSPFAPTVVSINQEGRGFPVFARPESLTGFYKFTPLGATDALIVSVTLYKNNMTEAAGGGIVYLSASTQSYTQFTVPIEYASSEIADSAIITLAVVDSSDDENPGTIGSFAIVDDLSFSGTTSVEDGLSVPASFVLSQNFPNPFNPATTIAYEIPSASFVDLRVFNVLGNEVAVLVNKEQLQGKYNVNFDAGNLSSGVYFYTLKAGNFKKTGKMILQK